MADPVTGSSRHCQSQSVRLRRSPERPDPVLPGPYRGRPVGAGENRGDRHGSAGSPGPGTLARSRYARRVVDRLPAGVAAALVADTVGLVWAVCEHSEVEHANCVRAVIDLTIVAGTVLSIREVRADASLGPWCPDQGYRSALRSALLASLPDCVTLRQPALRPVRTVLREVWTDRFEPAAGGRRGDIDQIPGLRRVDIGSPGGRRSALPHATTDDLLVTAALIREPVETEGVTER